jgi:hypothetical protein
VERGELERHQRALHRGEGRQTGDLDLSPG